MKSYRDILDPDNKGWDCLEVGIDGDEKPSGNFKYFGKGNTWKTLDNVAYLKPDIVADICDTGLPSESFDLIIISQTLEHVWDFFKAIEECQRLLKIGGHLIIDCPFMYPFHGTQDYGDYWRLSHQALRKLLHQVGLGVISCNIYSDVLTSALAQK
jgi:SAM-dependent methyltransferase